MSSLNALSVLHNYLSSPRERDRERERERERERNISHLEVAPHRLHGPEEVPHTGGPNTTNISHLTAIEKNKRPEDAA